MSYAACITAAGTPVLDYLETGSYQGTWYARTAAGFYSGSYGSCSHCDWRQSERAGVDWDSPESVTKEIDARIGREILKADPLSLPAFIASLGEWCEDRESVVAWASKTLP